MPGHEVPRTVVEVRDRAEAPGHFPRQAQIFINGTQVLLAKNGLSYGPVDALDPSSAVTVTLRLLPTELLFTHEEPAEPDAQDDPVRADIK